MGSSIVAIYDSRGRRFNNDDDLKVGSAVTQDQILNMMALGESVVTKEASSRSVSTARKRPESFAMKGQNLEQVSNLQSNSAYRVSTLKFDILDILGKKSSSYYIGVESAAPAVPGSATACRRRRSAARCGGSRRPPGRDGR